MTGQRFLLGEWTAAGELDAAALETEARRHNKLWSERIALCDELGGKITVRIIRVLRYVTLERNAAAVATVALVYVDLLSDRDAVHYRLRFVDNA